MYYLGLADEVVGITKFCVHPAHWRESKKIVGGTKNLHIDRIDTLLPDLIIANKEENEKEAIEELAKKYPVLVTDVKDITSATQMIADISTICDRKKEGEVLVKAIEEKVSLFKSIINLDDIPTAYLIWQEPYMTIGADTFIHSMLSLAGFKNIFGTETRYPSVTLERLQKEDVQLILLSSEPYPFSEKHIQELKNHLPEKLIRLVDGEMCSWYGSRMLQGLDYLHKMKEEIAFAFANGKPYF